jgi:hypothetical protein
MNKILVSNIEVAFIKHKLFSELTVTTVNDSST